MPEIKEPITDSADDFRETPVRAKERDDTPSVSDDTSEKTKLAPLRPSGLSPTMHYSDILSIDARIVGFSDGIVELECLIDPDEGRTEMREFDAAYLEGIGIPLEYHQYVYIRVLRGPGRVVHTFSNGDYRRKVVAKLFERVDPFEGLSSDEFNDPVEW